VWLIVGKTPSSQSSAAPKYDEDQTKRVDAWMKECSQKVQVPRMICGPVPQGFDGDEEVFAVFPNVALYEPRAVRYSRGYYGGPTIRIARGLSFRLGASAGRSESVEEEQQLDVGRLVVTTKRLAFIGSMRTNSVDLNDLIAIDLYEDGIRVHREHKQRAETYALTRPLVIADGEGQGLQVGGFLMQHAVQFGKIFRQATPQQIEQLRRENAAEALLPKPSQQPPKLTLVK
jgi:hypothetical protein